MKKSKVFLFVALALFMTLMVACSGPQGENQVEESSSSNQVEESIQDTYPIEIIDGEGNKIIINEKIERIVSIDPSQTEILFELGLADQIYGVSDFCDYPVAALDKEKVGNAFAINVEKILELDPDVVFLYNISHPEAVEQLRDSGIHIVVNSPETTEEIFHTILQLSQMMDIEEKGQEIVEELKGKKEAVISKMKNAEKVRVFYQLWDEPLMTAGAGSFIDELITLSGGINVAADGDGAYPQYSVEAMIEKDPEVYIAPAHTLDQFYLNEEEMNELKESIKSRPGYDVMAASKNNRIELLEPNIVSRPGIRIIQALELFAEAIHPELF